MSGRVDRGRRVPQRVGVFGGTFDPVHLGHLRVAEEARELLDLDRVLFVPSATPPHKLGWAVAPAAQRLSMVRLAVKGNPRFAVSTVETARAGRSYTVDTLRLLGGQLPEARLVLLVGLDAFRDIGMWKDYRSLFGLADVAVMSRPRARRAPLLSLLPVAAREDFCYRRGKKILFHDTGKTIIALDVTALDVSASDIRLRLERGLSIRYLVPGAVEDYLERHRLYRGRSGKS